MKNIDISQPEFYINRELSLLQFQRRVLAQACNENVPILERLRFLCISSTNLDEFFQIRVAGLMHRAALEASNVSMDNITPEQMLDLIRHETHLLVEEQYRVLNDVLIPELSKEGVWFLKRTEWNDELAGWIQRHFINQILPVLSPLGLDTAHPFPRVFNKSLNFIISLEGKDAFGRDSRIAIVQAPSSLPRLIRVPGKYTEGEGYVFLTSIIHTHIEALFPGMNVTGCYQFRVTRDSELFIDEEESVDLMGTIKGELQSRRLTDAVRLEVADNCTKEMSRFLLKQFKLKSDDLYTVNGPVNLNRLLEVVDNLDRPDLKYPPITPGLPQGLSFEDDMFNTIKEGDVLLFHPYESFTPVVSLLSQAAVDPKVLAIKMTLYRTGKDSPLVNALVDAAKLGKEVTVVFELRARFDEAANIELATRLQDAGAHVVYGVVGYKTHAKMLLIVRRENKSLIRYVHLGTGNYHPGNAKVYTDYSYMTRDSAIGEDVHKLFLQLTGLGKVTRLKKILESPFTLQPALVSMIRNEAKNAKAGKAARIIAKINSLVDRGLIKELYRASQAGVKIELIVRGICRLRPGVKGVSENITVRSVVGRFLEHSRIYYFQNENNPKVYCSSADWMERNLFRRVEACFPILDEKLKKQIISDGLLSYLSDNMDSWLLQSDGSYKKLSRTSRQKDRSVQAELLEKLSVSM
ncbi:MAG: polyphosphate kinase 1 [Gammaproteobacteria bacterium]|nr:polyphosphate kinase 1 [Gammaproteobacteria bacterium]MCW8986477.1 polyphosphate kinase 1 [Gammaproteobacteria bacterium]